MLSFDDDGTFVAARLCRRGFTGRWSPCSAMAGSLRGWSCAASVSSSEAAALRLRVATEVERAIENDAGIGNVESCVERWSEEEGWGRGKREDGAMFFPSTER